jgi:hypothetical protein
MDLNETQCEDVDWIYGASDRVQWWVVMNMEMNRRVP